MESRQETNDQFRYSYRRRAKLDTVVNKTETGVSTRIKARHACYIHPLSFWTGIDFPPPGLLVVISPEHDS